MADAGYAEGDTAFNPQTQEEAVFTGGKWVVKGSPQMPLPQGDEAPLKELQTQANDAQWLARKAQQFKALQAGGRGQSPVQTGTMFKEFGIPHIAENINPLPAIASAVDPRIDQLESISNQAWVHMRPAGSGAIRGYEAGDFKEAFPNIEHWGRANNGIADRLQDDASDATNKLAYADQFIRSGQGTFAQAMQAWGNRAAATPAPVDSSKPLPGGPQAGYVEGGYQFKGGNPADAANWIKVQ